MCDFECYIESEEYGDIDPDNPGNDSYVNPSYTRTGLSEFDLLTIKTLCESNKAQSPRLKALNSIVGSIGFQLAANKQPHPATTIKGSNVLLGRSVSSESFRKGLHHIRNRVKKNYAVTRDIKNNRRMPANHCADNFTPYFIVNGVVMKASKVQIGPQVTSKYKSKMQSHLVYLVPYDQHIQSGESIKRYVSLKRIDLKYACADVVFYLDNGLKPPTRVFPQICINGQCAVCPCDCEKIDENTNDFKFKHHGKDYHFNLFFTAVTVQSYLTKVKPSSPQQFDIKDMTKNVNLDALYEQELHRPDGTRFEVLAAIVKETAKQMPQCDVCNIVIFGQDRDSHERGSLHKCNLKKLRELKQRKTLGIRGNMPIEHYTDNPNWTQCTRCNNFVIHHCKECVCPGCYQLDKSLWHEQKT